MGKGEQFSVCEGYLYEALFRVITRILLETAAIWVEYPGVTVIIHIRPQRLPYFDILDWIDSWHAHILVRTGNGGIYFERPRSDPE